MLKSFVLSHNGLSLKFIRSRRCLEGLLLKVSESENESARTANIFEHVNSICKTVGPVTEVSEKTILRT